MKRFSLFILFFLLAGAVCAESFTATITAYNKASLSGDVGMAEVAYEQIQTTRYKSRLQAGDRAVMTISNMPVGVIDSVVLMMHSNAKSGAGSLRMSIAGADVWTIADASFSDASWAGCYSSAYMPISKSLLTSSGDIEIEIMASVNSLYWESATIYYHPAPPAAYTVGLHTQLPDGRVWVITEVEPGAGIILPSVSVPNDDWLFLGWSEVLVEQQLDCPFFHAPGTHYYPMATTSLYAVYKYADHLMSIAQDTLRTSGEYALVCSGPFPMMASGPVLSHTVSLASCNMTYADSVCLLQTSYIPQEARYLVSFEGDSAYIQHLATQTWLGYRYQSSSNSSLISSRVGWQWCEAKDRSLSFFHHPQPDHFARMLVMECDERMESFWLEDKNQYFSTDPSDPLAISRLPEILLFPVEDVPDVSVDIWYSSYPQLTSVPSVEVSHEVNWTLPVDVYTVDGRLYRQGCLAPSALPSGIWIVRQGAAVSKIRR